MLGGFPAGLVKEILLAVIASNERTGPARTLGNSGDDATSSAPPLT
jgi:hypothetical protein